MRKPVRFADGIEALAGIGITHFIEIGPHPVLCAAGAECLGERAQWLASMRRDGTSWDELLASVQRLFVDGARIDWKAFDAGYARRRVAAPTYPFQRTRHWIDAAPASGGASAAEAWTRANAAAERQSAQGPLGLDVASYPGKWDVLERITRALIVNALRGAGLFQNAMRIERDALLARLGVARDFQPLVQRWLQRLVASGDLGRDGETYFSTAALTPAGPRRIVGGSRACASPTTRSCSPTFVTAQVLRSTWSRAVRARWRRCFPVVPSHWRRIFTNGRRRCATSTRRRGRRRGIRGGRTARSRISRAGDRRRHRRDDGGRRALAATALRLPFLRRIGLVP